MRIRKNFFSNLSNALLRGSATDRSGGEPVPLFAEKGSQRNISGTIILSTGSCFRKKFYNIVISHCLDMRPWLEQVPPFVLNIVLPHVTNHEAGFLDMKLVCSHKFFFFL